MKSAPYASIFFEPIVHPDHGGLHVRPTRSLHSCVDVWRCRLTTVGGPNPDLPAHFWTGADKDHGFFPSRWDRASPIDKGIIYAPERGRISFTVPDMAAFIARQHED